MRIAPAVAATKLAGFSQGDLLLLLGSLLILASTGLSAISKAKENSRLSQCLENVKVINGAFLDHARDNGGKLLTAKTTPPPGGWWAYKDKIRPYLKKTAGGVVPDEKLFACPSDRGYTQAGEKLIPFSRSAKHSFTSYVFNGVTLPGIPNVSGRELESLKEPAKTVIVMEWAAHGPLSWHRSKTGKANTPFYDGAECVLGFADGGVRLTPIHFDGINAAYTRDPAPGYAYRFSAD